MAAHGAGNRHFLPQQPQDFSWGMTATVKDVNVAGDDSTCILPLVLSIRPDTPQVCRQQGQDCNFCGERRDV